MKRIFLLLSLFCTFSTLLLAQYKRENDISYSDNDNAYAKERCKLDVYYPADKKDVPVVVWFHGGGIEGGSKYIDSEMLDAGYTVIAANYRLLPKATIDEVLDDAAAAVAWGSTMQRSITAAGKRYSLLDIQQAATCSTSSASTSIICRSTA